MKIRRTSAISARAKVDKNLKQSAPIGETYFESVMPISAPPPKIRRISAVKRRGFLDSWLDSEDESMFNEYRPHEKAQFEKFLAQGQAEKAFLYFAKMMDKMISDGNPDGERAIFEQILTSLEAHMFRGKGNAAESKS
jgi:hypothetical protein